MWTWAIGEDGFIGHYLGWVPSRVPQVGLGKWFLGGFIGRFVFRRRNIEVPRLFERSILSLPFHSPLSLQSLSLVHGLSFCGGLRSSYSLGSFLVAHYLWGCLLFHPRAGRIGVGSQYRYPSFFEYTLLWYMFEFLGGIVYLEYLFYATPSFSGDKWFLSFFEVLLLV